MQKNFFLFLSLFLLLFHTAKAGSPTTPWSQVIPSSNGKYILVLISPKVKEQEEYIFQSREFWRKGGIPKENIPEAEKSLQKEIDLEVSIRNKYQKSGLYTVGKYPRILWEIDFYDIRFWVRVSNDAEHIVIGKWAISPIYEKAASKTNPNVKEIVKVLPNMDETVLTFYSSGKLINSYKASELIASEEKFQSNSDTEFIWSDEGVLNEKAKTVSIKKKNDDELVFNLAGNLLSGKLPNLQNLTSKTEPINAEPPKSENNKPFCVGIALLFGFVLSLLFGH